MPQPQQPPTDPTDWSGWICLGIVMLYVLASLPGAARPLWRAVRNERGRANKTAEEVQQMIVDFWTPIDEDPGTQDAGEGQE